MKVMFLCASSEPRRDGVGDYARKLGAQLIKKHYGVKIVACNEKLINEDRIEEQAEGEISIEVLRLSGKNSWAERIKKIQGLLDGFNPDWISIHYVPYAFGSRGLPLKFVMSLRSLRPKAKIQVMFHEIWQGESIESTFKDKIIGFVQRKLAFMLIRFTKAAHVNTTNNYYSKSFFKRNVEAYQIPVFSNMPLGNSFGNAVAQTLPKEITSNKDKFIIGVFFGGFHPHSRLADNLKVLAAKIKEEVNKELVITHIGRSNGVTAQMEEIKAATGFKCFVLGEWNEQDVADYLLYADLGLSNNPKVLYQKSGGIAALLNNGCPVILLKDSFEADKRIIPEVKEFDESFDLGAFFNQDSSFALKYDVETSGEEYHKLFS